MNAAEFKAAMNLTTDRVVIVNGGALGGETLFVNFINLSVERHAQKRGGGAESENNRQLFAVSFPGNGKAKIEHMVNMVTDRAGALRGKTADVAKIAAYLGAYINRVAETHAPQLTHE